MLLEPKTNATGTPKPPQNQSQSGPGATLRVKFLKKHVFHGNHCFYNGESTFFPSENFNFLCPKQLKTKENHTHILSHLQYNNEKIKIMSEAPKMKPQRHSKIVKNLI